MDNTAQWPRCWFTMAEKRVHKPFPQPWLASGVWGCLRTFSLTRWCPCVSVVWEAKDGLKSVKMPAPQKSYSTTLRCESQGQKNRSDSCPPKAGYWLSWTYDLSVNKGKMQSIAQKSVPSLAFPQLGHFLINSSDFLFSSAVRFFTSASFSISSHRCPNIKGLGMLFTRGNFNSDRNWLWTKHLCNSKGLRQISHGPWLQNWTQTNLNFHS